MYRLLATFLLSSVLGMAYADTAMTDAGLCDYIYQDATWTGKMENDRGGWLQCKITTSGHPWDRNQPFESFSCFSTVSMSDEQRSAKQIEETVGYENFCDPVTGAFYYDFHGDREVILEGRIIVDAAADNTSGVRLQMKRTDSRSGTSEGIFNLQ